ncbi:MAG: VWA domain-containing protein [Gammaproteobacteria bacterium]|nr:VWA domain-containing protein [Gammaproteobacteria bacterium]
MLTRTLATTALLVVGPMAIGANTAQVYESEPNDTPATANPVAGAVRIAGVQTGTDQDGFMWTVSDEDARKRWTLELQGIAGALTVVEVFTVEFKANGVDVKSREKLFSIGTRGARPVVAENLIFEPGDYLLGVAHAGGGDGGGIKKGLLTPDVDTSAFTGETAESKDGKSAVKDESEGAFRLIIRQGDKLVVAGRTPENETKDNAYDLGYRGEHAAFYPSTTAWYSLEIPEKLAGKHWRLVARTAVGREMTLTLYDDQGEELTDARTDRQGHLAIPDLGLAPGNYPVQLESREGGAIRVVSAVVTGQRVAGEEAEPNDDWNQANRIDPGTVTTGRFGTKGDEDRFAFEWSGERAERTHTLRLESGSSERLSLCLLDGDGRNVQCRKGSGPIELVDLLLEPGTHGVRVDGREQGAGYRLRFIEGDPYRIGREVEPNDRLKEAVALTDKLRVKGRFAGRETDVYRLTVNDEPQLWRFQAIGGGVRKMIYYDGAGAKVEEKRFPRDSRRARLPNVFLLPGDHYLALEGEDSDYTLLARAIGPPDMNAEREPNDDDSRYHRLAIGQVRTGILSEEADLDGYRFFLTNWDRIRLTVTPPPDGAVHAEVSWEDLGGSRSLDNASEPGEPLTLEGLFPPGNYKVELSPAEVSEAEYRLGIERLPRYGCPADCEPNDHRGIASPLPRNHVIEGGTGDWYKADFYRLPVFAVDTDIEIHSKNNVLSIVTDTSDDDLAEYDRDKNLYRATLPTNTPTFLSIYTAPSYRLEISFPSGAAAAAAMGQSPINMALELERDTVAAYRRHGQRVAGTLELTNESDRQRSVNLEGTTSDHRWRIELDSREAVVPAGGSAEIPLTLRVPADAWAERAVRISVLAVDPNGRQVETFSEIRPEAGAQPVGPERYWQLPEPLLGGANVAWQALGGRWVATDEQRDRDEIKGVGSGYSQLFDGMAVKGRGLIIRSNQDETSATVELAGDEPVPVAGITLNPLGQLAIDHAPREFELALSTDGERYETALQGQAEPIPSEQAFVLKHPVPARYARLRLIENFTGEDQPGFGLGEWKVIAEPGTGLKNETGYNLADNDLGGHVVWSKPRITEHWDSTILREDEKDPDAVRLSAGEPMQWVVAFHHQRAARIARLQWVTDDDADAEQRIKRVRISAALDSPFGPWRPVSDWKLDGSKSLQQLELDESVWARYLRFTVPGPERPVKRTPPERIGVVEQSPGDDYRSILTEWGFASKAAFYESTLPIQPPPAFRPSGNNDRPSAAPLELGQATAGRVQLGKESDWYRLSVPDGMNLLDVTVKGEPTVRTRLHLEDAAGEPVMAVRRDAQTARHRYEYVVEAGEDYWIHVEEPPRNVVFSWDTSASVGAYLPVTYNALMAYAEDVVPGRDGVNFIPFGSSPLVADWYGEPYVLQTILNELPRDTSSSAAEKTLATSSTALAPREGTKAVVLITDAATTRHARVWQKFREVRPRIFALGLSSDGAFSRNPPREQDLLQGWTDVNGGHYDHVLSAGEMEVAFDRAATLLRAPAPYELSAAARFDANAGKPGTLAVVAGDPGEGAAAMHGAVELILDASGSMLQRMEGRRRIDIAKALLIGAVEESLPPGTPVALRVFGHQQPNACRTDLEQSLAPLDVENLTRKLRAIEARNLAKTPIADSLDKVRDDLKDATGSRTVLLVTDGKETCDGDPQSVIESLTDEGFDVTLNIVGFAIDDPDLAETFRQWANQGGGRYLSANDPAELSAALKTALQTIYEVRDRSGELVAEAVVGGDPVELEAGHYEVTVRSVPAISFDQVEIPPGEEVLLKLGSPDSDIE